MWAAAAAANYWLPTEQPTGGIWRNTQSNLGNQEQKRDRSRQAVYTGLAHLIYLSSNDISLRVDLRLSVLCKSGESFTTFFLIVQLDDANEEKQHFWFWDGYIDFGMGGFLGIVWGLVV